MKRDYITGDYITDLEKTVGFLKDRNISLEGREEIAEDFCQVYVYFNSERFDKFF